MRLTGEIRCLAKAQNTLGNTHFGHYVTPRVRLCLVPASYTVASMKLGCGVAKFGDDLNTRYLCHLSTHPTNTKKTRIKLIGQPK